MSIASLWVETSFPVLLVSCAPEKVPQGNKNGSAPVPKEAEDLFLVIFLRRIVGRVLSNEDHFFTLQNLLGAEERGFIRNPH